MKPVGLVRATSLAPFLRYVQEQGGSVERHLEAGHVPGELVEQPGAWISKLQVYRVLESATKLDAGEELGLQVGRRIKISDLGALGEAVARAATLKDACETFGRLLPQLVEGNTVDVVTGGRKTWFTYTTLDHIKGNRDAADHYGMLILLAVAREVAGPTWVPREVRLQTGTTTAFGRLQEWEEAAVSFDQPGTGFAFPSGWLGRPLKRGGDDLVELPSPPVVSSSLTGSVHALLATYLPLGGAPTMDMIGEALGLSPRTLKRRLAAEGVTYSHLLERVRFAFATDLLRNPSVTVKDVAHRLGYSGPNNFIRAFHRMAGCTPGEFRRAQPAEHAE